MITLLSYPRSGRNLLRHMLKCIDVEVYVTHRAIIYEEWPLKPHDKLIMLVRDYRESITRHLYSEKIVSAEMIGKLMGREFAVRDRASQYIENLVLFDLCQNEKQLIYYEDLINFGKKEFRKLSSFVNRDCEFLNWEKESDKSRQNYDSPSMSGNNIDYHKQRIEDVEIMENLMRGTNSYIFDKYLSRYEQKQGADK